MQALSIVVVARAVIDLARRSRAARSRVAERGR
jgi:hypothetical protein